MWAGKKTTEGEGVTENQERSNDAEVDEVDDMGVDVVEVLARLEADLKRQ